MTWFTWEGTNRDFLLALHAPNSLILWNVATGDPIWTANLSKPIPTFASDPYDIRHLALAQPDGNLLLINDVLLHKAPSGSGITLELFEKPTEFTQLEYHKAFQNILFAVSSHEIVCVETEYQRILWRTAPAESAVLRLMCCAEQDCFFTVSLSGTVSLWTSQILDDDRGIAQFLYEVFMTSDTQRQSAHHRISAAALCPVTQSSIALLYNSGKIAFYEMGREEDEQLMPYRSRFLTDMVVCDESLRCSPNGTLRLSNVGQMCSLGHGASSVRMRPMEELTEEDASHLVAVGSNQGVIHLVNVFDATIYKDLHVHTCPIKCLDWGGSYTLLSAAFAHSPNSSPVVRNDILVTDIRTGKSERLRPEVDESPVEILRVSFYHCYVAIGFRSEPLEIWHLKSMRLLRRMSRACPIIIDLVWSGKHNAIKSVAGGTETVFRENLVVLDQDCHLYHVVVKGLHVRDGKEVNTQWKNNSASMKHLVWKDDLLAMGDSSGRLSVWDLGRRQCRQTNASPRGPILKMTFSRLTGDHTLGVLHSHTVVLWDSDQLTILQQLSFGSSLSLIDLDLCGVCPVVLCSDNSFRYVPSSVTNTAVHSRDVPLLLKTEELAIICSGSSSSSGLASLLNFNKEEDRITNDNCGLIESVKRKRAIHRLFGNMWLYSFWTVVDYMLNRTLLPSCLSIFWPPELLRRRAEQMLSVLVNETDLSSSQVDEIVQCSVILGRVEWAIQVLLIAREDCRMSALRACLFASDVHSEGAQSVIKLVATNLIANNCLMDGVQLLFLIGHASDACRYLQAHGQWAKSFRFAKMNGDIYNEIGTKWTEHLCSSTSQRRFCYSLMASLGHWSRLKDALNEDSEKELAETLRGILIEKEIVEATLTVPDDNEDKSVIA
ncbi:hypothetical protein AB6A40_004639 [Gnathostoma spinigerum]|uniref:WD repeat-containing protein 11 n=1 Tax=Gnathostoma spinigerum TaxID=75299 RepID=A0ABD6ED41_9BILA